MAGYIGSKAVTLSTTAADVTGDAVINGDLTVKGTTLTVDSAAAQEIRLGDNDKMTFGDATGGDLQIYHDGSHSYISDQGTGNLRVYAANFQLRNAAGTETMLSATPGASVNLFYNGSQKLATTSTGVDITGTLTSDGLTVDGATTINSAATFTGNTNITLDSGQPKIRWLESDSTDVNFEIRLNAGYTRFTTKSDDLATDTERMRIDNSTGDISFYEDTGTTAKFFWDASAESLGIGTSSPSEMLHINSGTANTGLFIESTDANSNLIFRDVNSTANVALGCVGDDFRVQTAGSERMRITSGGNLLVGKTSSNSASVGVEARANGTLFATKASSNPAGFNRTTSDGAIVNFYKDNTTVGSIGADDGRVYIESSGGANLAGIGFSRTAVAVEPRKNSGWSNAEVDIGSTTYKFKDGHFSGTVNAANFNTTSDATLKTNVETLTGSLDAVKAMRGVSYDWIENGNSEVGVIAQEVEEVIPDVVSTNDQGIKSVKYGNLVGVLIEAIKEQQAQIDELKAQLNS